MDDLLQLGGNIELVGFREVDGASMVIIKKIVGNYARKFSSVPGFEKLSVTMKSVHGSAFELHGKVISSGKSYTSELTDRNLFFAFDKVLKKLNNSLTSF